MRTLEHLEQQLRDGDAAAVLKFADHEQARAHAERLLASDPAVREEFRGDAKALASHLRSLGAHHVARLRRRAELDADREATPTPAGVRARLSAGGADEWGNGVQIASALGVGNGFVADPRGRAAIDRAGVRRRSSDGATLWHLGDARAAHARLGGVGLLIDAGLVETWV